MFRTPRQFAEQGSMAGGFTPPQIADRYDFPAGLDGSGQCIAVIALGGGLDLDDTRAYFASLNLATPHIDIIPIDGAANTPGRSLECDAEVQFDIQIAGSVAPGATLAVYLAPDTDQGFLDAVDTAVHDAERHPSIISISLGQPEYTWSHPLLAAFDRVLGQAARASMTVICASGDSGSSAGADDGRAHVEFPASSPWVLACGGTSLSTPETVWNEMATGKGASGGGISDLYDVPEWQRALNSVVSVNPGGRRGRGVPDVAANADQSTGYRLRIGGRDVVVGGTSAAAPLWAGLCARINQHLGKPIGFINPMLYGPAVAANALRTVLTGNNGAYSAQPGWSACTGLGTPSGQALLAAFAALI